MQSAALKYAFNICKANISQQSYFTLSINISHAQRRISLKKHQSCIKIGAFSGGGGWIRTTEVERQQIYSLPPLATRELLHICAGAGDRT